MPGAPKDDPKYTLAGLGGGMVCDETDMEVIRKCELKWLLR